ncbi:YifB family Mg chelatase-like AAA ATPase [Mesobacterium pallidum]|uniref:YifB family Mg chelatase-like AAA ATPase n=1 Tax=Mesobacterium pallidum TaxID=2872037 RepID=UPI001EE35DCA|nr:YifB family Mg chelatase-like AAA ATPase [Mesobacterium pallidum]
MQACAHTVAFEGLDARQIEVQCAIVAGMPGFQIVGMAERSVNEARERVRAALTNLGVSLPARKVVINLSPADLPKEGSHYDLPIAFAILAAMEVLPRDAVESCLGFGELKLDGALVAVAGALPAALAAAEEDRALICPRASGPEAAWVGGTPVIAAATLKDAVQHLSGRMALTPAEPGEVTPGDALRDMRDVKGQEKTKRALEIAAAGRHHVLMTGPPGSGKSMLAARLPGLLPDLSAAEALETSMVHSLAGLLTGGGISRRRPFREPHHTASTAAIVGGGRGAKPGEVSLAHNGVLFMDEFPEFPRSVLETLRQPIETGEIVVSRANAHVRYPCRFLLVAAANPCKCGHLGEEGLTCSRAPICGEEYMGRISGPLLDRFDIRVDVPAVRLDELDLPATGDSSATIRARVAQARAVQAERYAGHEDVRLNADIEGALLEEVARPDDDSRALLMALADRLGLSARAYHRVLRVARTIADLDGSPVLRKAHVAEAASYRAPLIKD